MVESFLAPFLSFLLLYKYAALFIIAFVSAVAIPIPASTTLVAAGAFASQGYFDIRGVMVAAIAGNILGDIFGYWLAVRYGEEALRKIGFRRLMRSKYYEEVKEYIADVPQSIVFFSRFVTELGPLVNLLAGIATVPAKTYFLFEAPGEFLYVLLNAGMGYILGTQWQNNTHFLYTIGFTILPVAVTINLIQVLLFRRRRTRMQ